MVDLGMKMWHVSLFGGLTVVRQGDREMRVRSKKAGGVLGYLAYFRGQAFSREALADIYWPECDPDTARQNLRAALSILRRQLEPTGFEGTMLIADREAVWINADSVSTDVSVFFELLSEATSAPLDKRVGLLTEAVALVKGPLLPGHEGLWILPQQLHLDEEAGQAAVKGVEALCQLGDWDAAVLSGKSALAKWPLREDVHLAVMRSQALAGRPAEAIKQFEELERLLDEHWGEVPSLEASNLLDNLPDPSQTVRQPLAGAGVVSIPSAATQPTTRKSSMIPARINSFVNRTAELEALRTALEPGTKGSRRLVTITGPGGCGKTRLGLEAATNCAESRTVRIWYVPLADIEDASLVAVEIRKALGLDASPRSDALSQVTGFLGDEAAILVLDNFEQIVDHGAMMVAKLLESCPNLTCLVTSRRALQIEGEQLLLIKPFPIPKSQSSPAELELCESVHLFIDRARSARQDFRLGRNNAEAVTEICRRLDGLPLALELAASRISTCTPAQILGRLGEASEFLTSRMRNTPDRHRSLRAAVEWSVRLLSDEAKSVFRRVSVFRGGWTDEAAAFVCDIQNTEEQLQSLTECSLIQAEPTEVGTRFSMLEAVREQALSLLSDSGELEQVRERHLACFSGLVESLAPGLQGPEQGLVADQLEEEMDNLREAVAWGLAQQSCPESALRLVGGLRSFFGFRGNAELWHRHAKSLLEAPYSDDPAPKVAAYLCAGGLGFYRSEFEEANLAYQLAYDLATPLGLDALRAEALSGLGVACRARGDFDGATVQYLHGLELCDTPETLSVEYRIHYNLGLMREFQRRFGEAKSHYEKSMRLAESAKDKRVIARNLDALGRCALQANDPEEAIRRHQEARKLLSEVRDRVGEIEVLGNLALMELTLGRFASALEMFKETLVPLWEVQNFWELRSNTTYLATCLLDQNRVKDAAIALALTNMIDQKLTVSMGQGDTVAYEKAMATVETTLDRRSYEAIKERVRTTPLGAVISELSVPITAQASALLPTPP